jgi:hypothetical protein
MCSVPMYSWLNFIASWRAKLMTFLARSVNRSNMRACPVATSLWNSCWGVTTETVAGLALQDWQSIEGGRRAEAARVRSFLL